MIRIRNAFSVAVAVATLAAVGCSDDKTSESSDKPDESGETDDSGSSDSDGGGVTMTYPVTADVTELVDPSMVFFGEGDCAGTVEADSDCRWSPEGGSGGVAGQFSVSCGFSNELQDTFISGNVAQVEGNGGTAEEVDLGDVPAFVATTDEQVFLSVFLVDANGRDSFCFYALSPPLDESGTPQPFDASAYEDILMAMASRSLGG